VRRGAASRRLRAAGDLPVSDRRLPRLRLRNAVLNSKPFVADSSLLEYTLTSQVMEDRLGSLSVRVADEAAGAARLTAADPLFPSPLPTVSNVAVEFGARPPGEFVSLRIAVCAPQSAGRIDALEAYVSPADRTLAKYGEKPSMQPASRRER
jgi:hypothetical protein